MFGLFKKDPIQQLEIRYKEKMELAVCAQRNGDIEGYSKLSFEAEELGKEIDNLKKKQGTK
jgi:hypothetical protein